MCPSFSGSIMILRSDIIQKDIRQLRMGQSTFEEFYRLIEKGNDVEGC